MAGLTAPMETAFKKHNYRKERGYNSSFWKEKSVAEGKGFIVPSHR